ncbi:MAG: hypothetical protein IKK24_01600 [Clostridia bacterium]|nr:hypothetical protein [Clostridia bacterium]
MDNKTLTELNLKKTQWLYDKVWGVTLGLFHYAEKIVEDGIDLDKGLAEFDYELYAKQLDELGAGYCIVTVNQVSKYLTLPNETYEKYSGYKRGEASTNIDCIERLLNAFEPYGIELILCFSCDGPTKDKQAREGFGAITYGLPAEQSQMSLEFTKKWCEVIRESSLRYGKRIKGWWFDGTFYNNGYNEERVALVADAARAGNPDAIVACNIYGLMPPPHEREEYMREGAPTDNFTFGEMWNYSAIPEAPMHGHCRWHIWSWFSSPIKPLDENGNEITYTKEYLRDYVTKVHKAGGVVTLPCDADRYGRLSQSNYELLSLIKEI